MATQLLISLYQPDLVLNAGVAGCFEDMPIGSIVLAEGFCSTMWIPAPWATLWDWCPR